MGRISAFRRNPVDMHEAFELTVQDEQAGWPEMTSAIGRVVATSAWATIALQELAVALADSEYVYFLMEDSTMGGQINQVENLIKGPKRWSWSSKASPLHRESEEVALQCLVPLRRLSLYRNRIVHDEWYPDLRWGYTDGLLGRRATRYGKNEILSRRVTFHRVAYSLSIATESLNHTAIAVRDLRGSGQLGLDELRLARDCLATLDRRRLDAEAGRDPEWRWLERPSA